MLFFSCDLNGSEILHEFVNRFIYKMATEAAGARIEWETIAV